MNAGGLVSRLRGTVLSVPIFYKTLGIGLVVAGLFGAVTLVMARDSMTRVLHRLLADRTKGDARLLTAKLAKPLATGDLFTVQRELVRVKTERSDVRYVIVRDHEGRVIAHTFERAVPHDLINRVPADLPRMSELRILGTREGLLFEATEPIVEGHAGWMQLALRDQIVVDEVSTLLRSVLWGLAFCVVVGVALGLGLTHLVVHPIHRLEVAARGIEAGDFTVRSEIYSNDEIGHLAVAFNRMARTLQQSHRKIEEKEKARVALIERLVDAQEEERRHISRELHDQLGQSLSAVLLALQFKNHGGLSVAECAQVEERLRQVLDDMRRLVRDMRPPILDDYGLDSALMRYTEETGRFSGLDIDYHHSQLPGLGRLPAPIEVTLYRVAQEAITNIVRHAAATQASLVVLRQRGNVTLMVEDNGCGFAPERLPDGAGCGVVGMRERVGLIGGVWKLESTQGAGTTIRVSIPIDPEEPLCPSES